MFIELSTCFHSRHALAVVHFNCNLNRDVRVKKDGSQQVKVIYPKFKNGEATVRDVRVPVHFGKSTLI